MTDGKIDALRRDPVFRALSQTALMRLGREVELLDVATGEVLSPADAPPGWAYYCCSGRLHVLTRGRVGPQAVPPVLFLPEQLSGVALVAAVPSRVVALPARSLDDVLGLAPALAEVRRYTASRSLLLEVR
jgi:hypothetical protein